jgi:hypothetical protein
MALALTVHARIITAKRNGLYARCIGRTECDELQHEYGRRCAVRSQWRNRSEQCLIGFCFFGSSPAINEFCASSPHTSLRSLIARSLLCQGDYEFTSVSQIES